MITEFDSLIEMQKVLISMTLRFTITEVIRNSPQDNCNLQINLRTFHSPGINPKT